MHFAHSWHAARACTSMPTRLLTQSMALTLVIHAQGCLLQTAASFSSGVYVTLISKWECQHITHHLQPDPPYPVLLHPTNTQAKAQSATRAGTAPGKSSPTREGPQLSGPLLMSQQQMCQSLVSIAQKAGQSNRGLRVTWPLLARDVLALLGGLRRAVMLDYAPCLCAHRLAAAVQEMQVAVSPAGG